ncbi:MAG: hypothetical protein JWM88_859 [Verrucomicrobia bacterium]|nr:hypothetical protein [Verrucomicrobiota bacterium]
MKPRLIAFLMVAGLGVGLPLVAATANLPKPKTQESDLATPEARRAAVIAAVALAKVEAPGPLPEELPQPFNPVGFNRSSREAARTTDANAAAPKATGDHDILTAIARRVAPTGTFKMGDTRYLQFSKNRLKVGDHLTVTHEGQEYNLELTAIDATNFTLRLNREEITRPIKPGKNP